MSRIIPAAACLAVIVAACISGRAWADETSPLSADWARWLHDTGAGDTAFGGGVTAGPWTFSPVAGIRASHDESAGTGPRSLTRIANLGVRGAATVDSRFGAIYSRLSLSFERAFRTDGHPIATGVSVYSKNGDYGYRSEIDLMKLDADFAMQVSQDVTGFVDYDAEMDLGAGAEHQIIFRLKFDF